jgi:hypothetical protein
MDLHLNNLFDRFQEQFGTTSWKKKKKKPNIQIGTKGTKKKKQKQTKPNTDKGATTGGPLRTKRKPINK